MIERALPLTLWVVAGCGSEPPSSTADTSVVEASVDAVPDGPVERCSLEHGLVTDDAGAEDGDLVETCPPGYFCGQTGGVSGHRCCPPYLACSR